MMFIYVSREVCFSLSLFSVSVSVKFLSMYRLFVFSSSRLFPLSHYADFFLFSCFACLCFIQGAVSIKDVYVQTTQSTPSQSTPPLVDGTYSLHIAAPQHPTIAEYTVLFTFSDDQAKNMKFSTLLASRGVSALHLSLSLSRSLALALSL